MSAFESNAAKEPFKDYPFPRRKCRLRGAGRTVTAALFGAVLVFAGHGCAASLPAGLRDKEDKLPHTPAENDRQLWGNRGYIYSKDNSALPPPAVPLPEKSPQTAAVLSPEDKVPRRGVPEPDPLTVYTVQKGDTLGGISRKIYGSAGLWKTIFDANRDVLNNPNKIYPGQKLKIPGQ